MPDPKSRERRFALILGCYEYDDAELRSLSGPPRDAESLAQVLRNPKIGGFDDVKILLNKSHGEILDTLVAFFDDRKKDELLLLYFSGHGIKDEDGNLFLAARNTRRKTLIASGIDSALVKRLMNRSNSRRQVLVLDCCYSGAFPEQMTAKSAAGDSIGSNDYFQGKGRVVLTASDAMQYAFEGESVKGEGVRSLFTHTLVDGLETGKADLNKDGFVDVAELYQYVHDRLTADSPNQRPQMFANVDGEIIIASTIFPGQCRPPTPYSQRYDVLQDTRHPILDLIGPSYVLDKNFYFLDWNVAFDELVAKPLKLTRGQHASAFILFLVNGLAVAERAKKVFGGIDYPLTDTEELVYHSERYGILRFQKLAAQIPDNEGNILAWSVNLNLVAAEGHDKLWNDLQARLDQEVNWSKYAVSYDRLLLEFSEYHTLVQTVVEQVGPARRCIDLGAGTGNVTLKLLANPNREVWAVEANETMLRYFRSKIRAESEERGTDYSDRLTIVKDDILRLGGFPEKGFDAALLLNVLYTVGDREGCLRQINRILRPGGILALSTPHRDTDVDRLFAGLRAELVERDLFESLQQNFESAKTRHKAMDNLIHRDTKEDIRRYLENTGFKIANDNWQQDQYLGSVVVVKAIKTAECPPAAPPKPPAIPL